jgi:hypothetical protein
MNNDFNIIITLADTLGSVPSKTLTALKPPYSSNSNSGCGGSYWGMNYDLKEGFIATDFSVTFSASSTSVGSYWGLR